VTFFTSKDANPYINFLDKMYFDVKWIFLYNTPEGQNEELTEEICHTMSKNITWPSTIYKPAGR